MPKRNVLTNQYSNLNEKELRRTFLAASKGPRENGNTFFNNFIYKSNLFTGNYTAAFHQGLDLLRRCHAIDEDAFYRIHKGSAYYWIGSAAFLLSEFEIATFFFDAAVSEDQRAGTDPKIDPTPSHRYMLIDAEPINQASRDLVKYMQDKFNELISDYNHRQRNVISQNSLSLDIIRKSFLIPAISPGGEKLRCSATTLISFFLEWDLRNILFDIKPKDGTYEPFFIHLFKGCVLFESLLKENPKNKMPSKSTLGPCLKKLSSQLGISKNLTIGDMDFASVLVDLSMADESIETAIKFTGRVRNTLGHNLGWGIRIDKLQYHHLFRMISSSCLHAISCLY